MSGMLWDMGLMAFVVFGFMSGLAPSLATLAAAWLAFRVLPGSTGTLACGMILVFGSIAAKARMRDGPPR